MALPPELKKRINPVYTPPERYDTGIESFDIWTGGLPHDLVIIYGDAGAGKSMLCREIAKHSKKCLYFCCEVLRDAPPHSQYPNVDTIDYTRYRVNHKRAIQELGMFIDELKPELVIIDSVTSFFGITTKAVSEADIRDCVFQVHAMYSGKMPIIGISEMRGSGYNKSLAGGPGVAHGNGMLIEMDHIFIRFPSEAEVYKKKVGDDVYTIRVVKDKDGLANTKVGEVIYRDGELIIEPLLKRSDNGSIQSSWDGLE